MTVGAAIKIIFGLLALGIGIFLGLPGRYENRYEEIEEIMDSGTGRRRKVKRAFTPMAWMKRQVSVSTKAGRGRGRGFDIKAPDDR